METLIIQTIPMNGKVILKDATGFKLSWFNAKDEAIAWCKENNYKWRIQD